MQEYPEFQRALNDAADRAYREYLYGGAGPKAKSKNEIGRAMEEIQRRRRELESQLGVEEIKKEVENLKRQADTLKRAAMAKAAERGIKRPSFPSLPKERTPENMERYRSDVNARVETMRKEHEITTNPHMREIQENLKRRDGVSGLVCPVCGEGDQGNRINGKPACLMNAKHKAKGITGPVLLMTPKKAAEWEPPPQPKPNGGYTFTEIEGAARKGR